MTNSPIVTFWFYLQLLKPTTLSNSSSKCYKLLHTSSFKKANTFEKKCSLHGEKLFCMHLGVENLEHNMENCQEKIPILPLEIPLSAFRLEIPLSAYTIPFCLQKIPILNAKKFPHSAFKNPYLACRKSPFYLEKIPILPWENPHSTLRKSPPCLEKIPILSVKNPHLAVRKSPFCL